MREASSEVNRAQASTDNEHPVAETYDVAATKKYRANGNTRCALPNHTIHGARRVVVRRGCRVVDCADRIDWRPNTML